MIFEVEGDHVDPIQVEVIEEPIPRTWYRYAEIFVGDKKLASVEAGEKTPHWGPRYWYIHQTDIQELSFIKGKNLKDIATKVVQRWLIVERKKLEQRTDQGET